MERRLPVQSRHASYDTIRTVLSFRNDCNDLCGRCNLIAPGRRRDGSPWILSRAARAQAAWPNRSVRYINPYPPARADRHAVAHLLRGDERCHRPAVRGREPRRRRRRRRHLGSLERATVHYQPIVDLNTGAIAGFEALLRIVDADGKADSIGPVIEQIESDPVLLDRLMRRLLGIDPSRHGATVRTLPRFLRQRERAAGDTRRANGARRANDPRHAR